MHISFKAIEWFCILINYVTIESFLTKGCAEDDFWKESLSTELDDIRKTCHDLEKELVSNNQRLELSKQQYDNLEREFKLMKDERDSLRKIVSEFVQKLELEKEQKETALKELNTELQRQRDLGEGIKRFSAAFASRHRSFMSFNSELKSKIEELKTHNRVVVPVPKSLGCWKFWPLYNVFCNYDRIKFVDLIIGCGFVLTTQSPSKDNRDDLWACAVGW